MPSDSTYEIGMLANADAYTADTLDGTGHIRVTVSPACITVDFVRAYLPADTLSGLHHNGEVAFSYTIGNCTAGISDNMNTQSKLKVYPNPAKDKILVRLPDETKNYKIKLLNTGGQTISETQSTVMDVSKLSNGIYFLNVTAPNYSANEKIIINH
jgi:hypothetical protein